MKQQAISKKKLKTLKDSLPRGAMAKIARNLTTPELKVTTLDVYRVLSGKPIAYGKINPNAIILAAINIVKETKNLQQEATDSYAEAFETAENN